MCGIIGIVGEEPVDGAADREPEAAGIPRLRLRRASPALVGRHASSAGARPASCATSRALLASRAAAPPRVGIGHTRWATHGAPTERNAHPHTAGRVTVVHNGIIENFAELKAELIAEGRVFESDTDTEVVAHLIDHVPGRRRRPAGGVQGGARPADRRLCAVRA